MAVVPTGNFMMGSALDEFPRDAIAEAPVHVVTISNQLCRRALYRHPRPMAGMRYGGCLPATRCQRREIAERQGRYDLVLDRL